MKRLVPFKHSTSGKWAIQLPARLSTTGKRRQVYFETEDDAEDEVKRLQGEVTEHGKQAVTSEERTWINYAKQALGGNLSILPEVIQHWKLTGSGSITEITVKEAVETFKKWQLPRVSKRTQSDIKWRLDVFANDFKDRFLHQINSGELETWIYSARSRNQKKKNGKNRKRKRSDSAWTPRSFYKRISPLFDHALRHRWIAVNPLERIKQPETPTESGDIYEGSKFQALLDKANEQNSYLFPYLALAGFAWFRNSEIVRQYSNEETLRWEDIDFDRKRIIVRKEVGKRTKRRSGNARVVPMSDNLVEMLRLCGNKTGRIIDKMVSEFRKDMRKLHLDAKVPVLHNGLRRSAISHYLAYHPETGIGQLAKWAGSSEATINRHYLEVLTPEEGKKWFKQWEFTVEGEDEDLTIAATKI